MFFVFKDVFLVSLFHMELYKKAKNNGTDHFQGIEMQSV